MKMKSYTVFARAQASIFIVFWPFSRMNCVRNIMRNIIEEPRDVVKMDGRVFKCSA